jgi:hypothetical protein
MSQPPKPTELIQLPKASVLPALLAIGIAAIVVGLYSWWPYSIAGGILTLLTLVAWLRANRDEIGRMPRRQRTDTAPIPLSVSRTPE